MIDRHGYEYQCSDVECSKKLIVHDGSRVIICPNCNSVMEPIPMSFHKHMNEHVAQTHMSFPFNLDEDDEYIHEYMDRQIRRKLGDFLMNESGKVDIQEKESAHPDFKTYHAAVAILSVDELKQFYEHINRLEREIDILYRT